MKSSQRGNGSQLKIKITNKIKIMPPPQNGNAPGAQFLPAPRGIVPLPVSLPD